jgi:hypothetical protein
MEVRVEPVTWVVVAVVASLTAGFGAGWGLKPDSTADALEAQAVALADLQAGQVQLVEASARPVVLDAELRSELAQVPVQCRKDAGGDPRSPECAWATCLQFGQSSAQRPECRAVEALMLQAMGTEHECD